MTIRMVFIPLFNVLLLLSSLSRAQQSIYIDPALPAFQEDETITCLLVLKEQAQTETAHLFPLKSEKGSYVFQTLRQKAIKEQAALISCLNEHSIPFRSFYLVNALEVTCSTLFLDVLSKRDDISMMLSVPSIGFNRPMIDNVDERSGVQLPTWGVQMIKADLVWSKGIRGAGVTVGGQDTGYDWEHPALKNQYKGDSLDHNYTWHDAIHSNASTNPCGSNVPYPCDDGSHGTHTMGTMVGNEPGSFQIGVSPESQWIGCRNMDMGFGTPVTYLECFEWFLAPTDSNNMNPDPSKAPDVINNSWACPPFEGCNNGNFHIMRMAVENLKNAGVFVVASAGNSGPGCESISAPPAIFDESFVIGASNESDQMAAFSSRGPVTIDSSFRQKPDVVAPGVNTVSCVPGTGYASFSGTSMAGPHVAGAVALLISAAPDLRGQVDSIAFILKMTADTLFVNDTCASVPSSTIPNYTFGYGRINMEKALRWVRPDLFVATHSIQKELSIQLYPNPTDGFVSLKLDRQFDKLHIQILDALGILQIEKTIRYSEPLMLDLSALPKGIYFISIQSGSQQIIKKITKV